MAVHWWRVDRRAGLAAGALDSCSSSPSTVLIHQHYLADLAGGLILAAVACLVGLRVFAPHAGPKL